MPWSNWGNWWSGKKTPPSKKSGVITKRPMRAKLWSVRRVAVRDGLIEGDTMVEAPTG